MQVRNCFFLLVAAATVSEAADKTVPAAAGSLWVDPSDITSRNLIYGSGGKEHAPGKNARYTFVKEDLDGTNPKFVVLDEDGVKWKVKLGVEAKPETASSRLLWAVGYHTNEDYLLPRLLVVDGMPDQLKRGEDMKQADGSFLNVRMKRYLKHEEKAGNWKWSDNPFTATRELDGLRVMMAVINNWDLKDVNNSIYETEQGKIYLVSDLGASFGTTGESWTHERSKGNLEQYAKSKFITKTTPEYVNFGDASLPAPIFAFNPHEFFSRAGEEKIERRIPREHAKWIGEQLAKLSPEQLRDAFRAAGYSADDVNAFAGIVEKRIAELNKL